MPGTIFYRERRKVDEGDKQPRFNITAIYDLDLVVYVKHFRKHELEQLAQACGAELVEMHVDDAGHRMQPAE